MDTYYTSAVNTQILIALLKKYGVKKVIASPGTMNVNFVGSIQNDTFFEVYSAADERSAAYMACGMAAESGEYVCLSCTGATASRNYIPGLTEAYYRKLPIIAITSTQRLCHIGHNMEQVIDRTVQLNDMVKASVTLNIIHDEEDKWNCIISVNKALIEAKRHGGGPVHINLEAENQLDFSCRELPDVRKIDYFFGFNNKEHFPKVQGNRIAIFVGSHIRMTEQLEESITKFCEKYNAVVLCDQTSNYFGKYRVVPSIILKQDAYVAPCSKIDLLIHIGNVSGSQFNFKPKSVWRINEDGEIRDTFKHLKCVFEMREQDFFEYYVGQNIYETESEYLKEWNEELKSINDAIPELPYSNLWVAMRTINELPPKCVLHMGILNSLRAWDYFDTKHNIEGYANTGGFGIDGGLSSFIGGALAKPDIIHYGVFGDLAFFYDMNALGNRHLPRNIRIILINNGKGAEFRKYNHPANRFGEEADLYMAAAGHYGNKSDKLVKHYVEDLGFCYMSATNKMEYELCVNNFVNGLQGPVLLEVFTTERNDSAALKMINNIKKDIQGSTINLAKSVLGSKGIGLAKKLLNK